MKPGDDFDAEFARLKAGYLQRLPAIARHVQGAAASDDRSEVKRIAHRLKGSAGSYGCPEISEAAGLVEAAAETLPADEVAKAVAGLVASIAAQLGDSR